MTVIVLGIRRWHKRCVRHFTSIEICAGAGGQALGLEQAGFRHLVCIEADPWACDTLRLNRPYWKVVGPGAQTALATIDEGDVRCFDGRPYSGKVDLLAGGIPCPPYSVAGKQLGAGDPRDLFPEVVRLVDECRPSALMVENVKGLLDPRFAQLRTAILWALRQLGYTAEWRVLFSRDFGVAQLRPRAILVGFAPGQGNGFEWPNPAESPPRTVGEVLRPLMAERGWQGADAWARRATGIAPTLVGGSKRHGGPDLGPSRARAQWQKLGVDARGLADAAPEPNFAGMPRLTIRMAAVLQGFPTSWVFAGPKTHAYRQVGNALPPPVAHAVGRSIRTALLRSRELARQSRFDGLPAYRLGDRASRR